MKNVILSAAVILAFFTAPAQNYQCLQNGVKHYFINGNGYLRGIATDSVVTAGDTIIYYPFRTPRGTYYADSVPALAAGGSWLGGKVLQLSNGTFIFDSYWNDSVIIKTQARLGDSWTFYKDSGSVYYTAAVTAADTLTILSSLDSVKTITINARNSSGIIASDPLNNFQIVLSRNHGFVQVFDLYTFPYHQPDSVYRPGLDFFLDRSTLTYPGIIAFGGNPPAAGITLFHLVDYAVPDDIQLHNWNTGDVIESSHGHGMTIISSDYTIAALLDTVTSKTVAAHTVTYVLSGSHYSCSWAEPCMLVANAGTYTFSDSHYSVANPAYIPENAAAAGNYLFYNPGDTSFCLPGPAYTSVPPNYNLQTSFDFTYEAISYKWGLGETHYTHFDDEPFTEEDGLQFLDIGGVRCGTPLDTVATNAVPAVATPAASVHIMPNPAMALVSIAITGAQPVSIELCNLAGQVIRAVPVRAAQQQYTINVSNVPPGIYMVCIADEYGRSTNMKLVVEH